MTVQGQYTDLGAKNSVTGAVETPYLTAKVSFLIRCAACHYGLCKMMEIGKRGEVGLILVEPCPRCLEAAKLGKPVEPLALPERDRAYWGLEERQAK